jgi:hypothetical protein
MTYTRRQTIRIAAGGAVLAAVGKVRAAEDESGVGAVSDIVNVAWGTTQGAQRDEVDDEDRIFMSELIETEDESAVVILFADGSKLTIGENAKLTIDKYVYNSGGSGEAAIKMIKGAFRFVSGTIPKENVKLETPTVTIGIRGTELVFDVSDDGETEMSTVSGEADCTDGSGETLRVAANESVVVDRNRRFRGRVRRFMHRSRSLAVAEGLEGARKRWHIRKQRRRRNRRNRRD